MILQYFTTMSLLQSSLTETGTRPCPALFNFEFLVEGRNNNHIILLLYSIGYISSRQASSPPKPKLKPGPSISETENQRKLKGNVSTEASIFAQKTRIEEQKY